MFGTPFALDQLCLILWDLLLSAYCFFQGSAFEPRIATKKSMENICERKRKGVTWVVCKLFHIDCPEFWSRNSHFAWNQLLTNIRHIFDQNLNISSPGIFPGHLSVCRCSSPTQPSNQIWRWWYLLTKIKLFTNTGVLWNFRWGRFTSKKKMWTYFHITTFGNSTTFDQRNSFCTFIIRWTDFRIVMSCTTKIVL